MKKWFVNLTFALMLIASVFVFSVPTKVVAEEQKKLNIVAIGDSITTGYGLQNSSDLFVNKIAAQKNANLTNLAVNGYKSNDIYSVITSINNYETINTANTILLTVGGNDILQPVIEKIEFNLDLMFEKDFADAELIEILTASSQVVSDEAFKSELSESVNAFNENFSNIVSALRSKNNSAQIIFQTVYNPAEKWADTFVEPQQAIVVNELYNFFNSYIAQVNNQINNSTLKNTYTYEVFDTYSAFQNNESSELLTNINNFDIHPNIAGNNVIYNGMITMIKDLAEAEINTTTIKIFTNGIYCNDPENSEIAGAVGGTVEGLVKDENGYDIFEIEVGTTKDLVITENEDYKLVDVKLGESSIGSKTTVSLDGSNLPNTISIYFLQKFEITFSTGYNGYLIVNSVKLNNPETNIVEQVLFGNSITCNFVADYGYELNKVSVDGTQQEITGSSYVFENVNSNHTFMVEFKKIEETSYTNPTYNITLKASTESLPYGSVLNVQVITSGNVYNEILNLIDPLSTQTIIYDFSLKKGNLTISPNGKFSISIPVSYQFNMEKTGLYYVSEDNQVEEINYSYDEETRMLTFETDHCSYYVLLQEGELVKSYWWVWIIVGAVLLIAAIVIIIVVVKKKKDDKIKAEIQEKNKDEYFSY